MNRTMRRAAILIAFMAIAAPGATAESGFLDLTDLSQSLPLRGAPAFPPDDVTPPYSLKEMERALILKTLQVVQGNRNLAADLLGVSRRGLDYKLKELRQGGNLSEADGWPQGGAAHDENRRWRGPAVKVRGV